MIFDSKVLSMDSMSYTTLRGILYTTYGILKE